jgi:antitoxin component YwqK of YwqJK toxin-antitoxin module
MTLPNFIHRGLIIMLGMAALVARAGDDGVDAGMRIVLRYDDGQPLRAETWRTNGAGKATLEGPTIEYDTNGHKRLQVEYANGTENGPLTEWDPMSGKVIRQGAFKDGRETGRWTWFQTDGDKLAECVYKGGKIQGHRDYWLRGKKVAEEIYNGAGEMTEYTAWRPDGSLEKRGRFKHGKKDGEWIYQNADGSLLARGEWKDGQPWQGTCGVPVSGDAGSLGGLETFSVFDHGQKQGLADCWRRDSAFFRDCNHDGKIDLEVSGERWRFDGVDTYKVDTNYDGYYDLEYGFGGIAGRRTAEKMIHQAVPVRDGRFVPIEKPVWLP